MFGRSEPLSARPADVVVDRHEPQRSSQAVLPNRPGHLANRRRLHARLNILVANFVKDPPLLEERPIDLQRRDVGVVDVTGAGGGAVEFHDLDALAPLNVFGGRDHRVESAEVEPLEPPGDPIEGRDQFIGHQVPGIKEDGALAFVVHKENSPREPLEIFAELVAADPSILLKRVAFDFPRDVGQVRAQLRAAGLAENQLWEGEVVFQYGSPEGVLEHLLKSGAGTAFYDAIDPDRRDGLTRDFLQALAARHPSADEYLVTHEYVACLARKP